jgi:hypothetical protein
LTSPNKLNEKEDREREGREIDRKREKEREGGGQIYKFSLTLAFSSSASRFS